MYALSSCDICIVNLNLYNHIKVVYILDFLEAAITAYDDIWNTKKLNCLN